MPVISELCCRLEFEYDGITTRHVARESTHSQLCSLSPGEVINRIKTWNYDYLFQGEYYPVRAGIQFFTTKQTCGPYGFTNTNDTHVAKGNILLSVNGWAGASFDKIVFYFDRCVRSME